MAPSFNDYFDDPAERAHLLPLMTRGADPESLARYAAWLTAKGDDRAELVSLVTRLLGDLVEPPQRRALALRVQALSRGLSPTWLKLVLSPVVARNCGEARGRPGRVRFAYECPESWLAMRTTERPGVRLCEVCNERVHRCESVAEAERLALEGACIAVTPVLADRAVDHARHLVVGHPDVFELWAAQLFQE